MAGRNSMRMLKGFAVALGGSISVGVLSAVAWAQESEEGSGYSFGVSTGIRHDSNSNLSRTSPERKNEAFTQLSFGLKRQTARSDLDLTLDGELVYEDSSLVGTDFDFKNPGVALAFARELSSSRLSFDASYNEADIDSFVSLLDPVSGEIITESVGGQRQVFSSELGFHLNEDAPLEAQFSLSRSGVRYVDTVSTSLDDVDQWRARAQFSAEITPLATLKLDVSHTDREERDTTTITRQTDAVSIGLDYDISPVMTLNTRVGYSNIDQSGSATLTDRSGTTFALGVTRDVPMGSVGVSIDQSVVANGTRDRLLVSADLEGQRQNFESEIGLSRQPYDTTDVVAKIGYTYDLPRAQLSVTGVREVRVDSDGFDEVTTQIRAGWNQQINSVSGFSVVADFSAVDFSDPTTLDAQRQVLTTSYSRAITSDWQLTSGLRMTVDRRDTLDNATSNSVFLTLDRQFSFKN